nr:InlB B-repeat-containing protein [Lacrimispora indolis]
MQKRAHRKIGRFFSLLMTVVLVCSMIPMNAYANDETVSLFNEELDMELNNTEEDETENIIPADDDLTLLEEEVPAEVDEEETLSHAELEDESVIPEEIPLIQQEEVTETTVETMAEAFDAPQPETVMVIFDPDDGTQYEDFYKTTVPVGGKITHKPADPTRDGYLFKGWYGYSDENDEPVKWDFANDTVSENTTLWAAWEEAWIVAFDPDDGTQYEDFYKTTVPVGGKVSDKPADPTRDGYLFKGWYGYLDENDKPVMWDFANDTVSENTTLWAAWEEACIVAFDPDDGTQYEDFYKTTVPVGGKVSDKPADPTRDGYLFKGWYGYLDENDKPVMWDFENDTVAENTTLWAAWEEACIVAFDPDDGTQYEDFYKTTVPVGGKVSDKPADPTRDGYLFKGWYGYLDENDKPVMWDFENDTVAENTTLWAAWEEACIVAFDPEDGTQYEDFYKTTVPVGGKVSDKPADPTRDGYLFKGWYGYLDENDKPVMWDFANDTVTENTTLWAAWEEACIVAFDPEDGTQYEDFYKTTVPVGGKVSDKPADPTRDGYLFKGWYGYLDENDKPVMWDFENDTVAENTTLWAAWEEACIVAFDPEDGTQYEDFYKTTVPVGGKVSDKPADPTRDGYLFKGWYGYLDENDKPVMWDFENGTVTENMTLWASWKEDSNGGNNNGGNGEGENNNNGGNGEGENNNNGGNGEGGNNNNGGNSGGGTGGSGGGSSGGNSGPVVSGNAGNNTSTNINEQEVPKSSADSERVDIDEQEVPKEKLDYLPKTGEDSTSRIIYGTLILLSLFMFGISLPYRKKTI